MITLKPTCRLISNAFMLGMHDQARTSFQKSARERRFEAGQALFRAGEEADCFFLICTGQINERYAKGSEFSLELGEGDVIGASSLVPPYRRISTAIAATDVDALAFDARQARKLSEDDHDFGFALYQRLFNVMVDRLIAASGGPPQGTAAEFERG